MTDLISNHNAETERLDATDTHGGATAPLAWAPIEPAPKKKRLGLWIGLGSGLLALGAAAASTILIAPGTTVAGIPVGFLTPGAAAESLANHLAVTEITLTGAGGDVVVTGADLGASIDATALAEQAFAAHPMWNVTSWGAEAIPATFTLDPEAAERTLRAAVPASYEDAVDATVVFDEGTSTFVTTPAETGTGIDLDALTAAFTAAMADGSTSLEYPGGPAEAQPAITDDEAAESAATLNTMLGTIGFYVGDERTVPVTPAVAATWLSAVNVDGELQIEADEVAIQASVDGLAEAVNRAPVNATNITNSDGKVLREETVGVTGRELGDTSGAASEFATALENGEATYALAVTETPFETVSIVRTLTVDLSEQRTYLIENGEVVKSWRISSGKDATPTRTGHFTVRAHVRIQDMRGRNADGSMYVTKDVPWVSYFNGDQAFHGTWWHSNFGTQMSHGCVNMTFEAAKQVYEASPLGTEVWVRR